MSALVALCKVVQLGCDVMDTSESALKYANANVNEKDAAFLILMACIYMKEVQF